MKTLQVRAVKLKDINNKDLLYITINEGEKRVTINVGQKTFDKVQQLIQGDQTPKDNQEMNKILIKELNKK